MRLKTSVLSFFHSVCLYRCVCLLTVDILPPYPNLFRSTRFIPTLFYIICLKRTDGIVFLLIFPVNIPKYSLQVGNVHFHPNPLEFTVRYYSVIGSKLLNTLQKF